MKKNTTCLAIAICLTSSSLYAEGFFETHGYLRSGVLFNGNDNLTQFNFASDGGAPKTHVGRLGVEVDNMFELDFVKGWNLDDGKFIKIHNRIGQHNTTQGGDLNETLYGLNIDGTAIGLLESYIEFGGIFGNEAVMWGGRRYYQRSQNFSFINDFFYADFSGTGVGVEKVPLGSGSAEFAYITADVVGSNDGSNNDDGILHSLHAGYDVGKLSFDLLTKWYPTNSETENTPDTDFATTGTQFLAAYNMDSFFGANGSARLVFQAGEGLGAGTGLGCTISNYCSNGYNPGNGVNQYSSDTTLRFLTHGSWYGNNMSIHPFLSVQQSSINGIDSTSYDAIVRPVFSLPSIDNFILAMEFGHTITDQENVDSKIYNYKYMLAPTWVMGTGEGPSPEISLFAGVIGGDNPNGYDEDLLIGFQVNTWW